MPSWLRKVLTRVRTLASARRVLFTLKARQELACSGFGMDEEDAVEVLANLAAADSAGRLESSATDESMYLFKPRAGKTPLYLKLILRDECIVVSFHEDEGDTDEEE